MAVLNPAPAPAEPQKKKKRTVKKKKPEPQTFNAEQISALIQTTSGLVASRPNMGIWQLQPEEANQLAQPIANMIANSEIMQKMSEHTDAVALVTAAMVIFTPRVMAQAAMTKEVRKQKRSGGVTVVDNRDRSKPEKGKSERSDGRVPGRDAAHGENHVAPLYELIPDPI